MRLKDSRIRTLGARYGAGEHRTTGKKERDKAFYDGLEKGGAGWTGTPMARGRSGW